MTKQQADPPATPMTVRDVLLLVWQADAYLLLGNEDVPVALCMERAALQHAETAASSPDDPPEFARRLEVLRQPRMVKKLEPSLIAEVTTLPSPTLRLACCPPIPHTQRQVRAERVEVEGLWIGRHCWHISQARSIRTYSGAENETCKISDETSRRAVTRR